MRLFVGLALPEDVRDRLEALAGGVPGARWVPWEAMHLTLRFIGEVGRHEAEDIDEALADIRAPAFDLELSGLGVFTQGRHARALWAGVDRQPSLDHLQQKVETAINRTGQPPESRKFKPHVTLARLSGPASDRLQVFVERHGLFRAGPFAIDHFILFESHLGTGHAHYEALAEYPLGPL